MKTNTIISLCFLTFQGFAQKNKPKQIDNIANSNQNIETKISLTPEKWTFQEGKVEFFEYKGLKAIRLNEKSGDMIYNELNFKNGTIEFDVEVNRAMPFPTIYYRWQSKSESEHVYLRTGVADKKNAVDAVQYASIINGVIIWDLQYEFQSAARIKIGEWNHVKLVVSGKQLRVYINNSNEPNLEIPCMEGNTQDGKIGIGTGFPGQAIFANIVVKPNETEGLQEQAGADITKHDTRYIRDWQVSKPDSLPQGRELNAFMLPKKELVWENIKAERRGLVNLSRKFGQNEKRKYVWLRAKIKSEYAQNQIIKLGFSDEIWVFMNQIPIYSDKSIYYLGQRRIPDGRISIDNCTFQLPLNKGENELIIGISNDFYGWGIMARLDSIDGIEIIN